MLKLTIPKVEAYDEVNNLFFTVIEETTLHMEHSLVSLSKWEAIWGKPFLSDEDKTQEEAVSYFQLMTLTPDIPPEVYYNLSAAHYDQISEYINSKQSATWFTDLPNQSQKNEVVTAEIIYYWMSKLLIPIAFENWHLGRLFTQIKVFSEKDKPEQKMSKQEAYRRQREINAQRRAELGTKG